MATKLPQPIGRQKEVLCLPATGHVVVLGTAGSGKTTLALHRAMYLANPGTDHHGRTLLVTFNRCLVSYLEGIAGGMPREVDVRNYHTFVRGYLASRDRMSANCICDSDFVIRCVAEAVEALRKTKPACAILDRPPKIIAEECRWIAQQGISSVDSYVSAKRVGREETRIIKTDRPIVFQIYEMYREIRATKGKLYDWQDLSHTVLEEMLGDQRSKLYRHIIIDEGQDLSPIELRSLAASIPVDGSLTFFGDMAQQIYGKRQSWRSAGLNVAQAWKFEENYRNTQQIAVLALAVAEMPLFPDTADLVTPKAPAADGPLPALVSFRNEAEESRWVANVAKRSATSGTVAILFRDRSQEKSFVKEQSIQGTRLHKDLNYWPSGPGIFYGTYHSAKGLEFDVVILPHLSTDRLPHPPDAELFGAEDASADDSRLLYVGITRARATLILTHAGVLTDLLPKRTDLYQRSGV